MNEPEPQPRTYPTWEEVQEAFRKMATRRREPNFATWFNSVVGNVEEGADGFLNLRLVTTTKYQADGLREKFFELIYLTWRQFSPDGKVIIAEPAQNEKTQVSQPEPRITVEAVQLRLKLPDDTRPFSNALSRCALFSVVSDKERRHFKDFHKLETFGEHEIWLKGDQFCQEDHDSFAQMVFMARHKPLGEDVHGSFRAFLAGLGKGYGSNARQAAAKSVERLISNTVKVYNKRTGFSYMGHLVNDGSVPGEKFDLPRLERDFTYQLNPKLAPLFAANAFTIVDWERRKSLKQQGLAKWMELWIEGNAEQFATKVETIREKCGSQTKTLFHFRQKLRDAASRLAKNGTINGWNIEKETDLLHIDRTPNPSQARHLEKVKSRKKGRPIRDEV